jgi:DNA-binding transcriptional LysR family regulator
VLCCAPSYLQTHEEPQRLEDLARHNCLRYAFYPFGDEWRFTGPDGAPAAIRVSGRLLSSSAETLRAAALDGQGVFLAPGFVAGEDVAAGRLVPILTEHRPVEFAIIAVYPHRRHLSAKVRGFVDLLARRIAEHRRWMHPEVPAHAAPPSPQISSSVPTSNTWRAGTRK